MEVPRIISQRDRPSFQCSGLLEGVWIYLCMKQKLTAHWIHILMGMLVLLKALYMFSEAEDKFYIKKTGTPQGWDVSFYAFSFLKGVMLFTMLVLIGTGIGVANVGVVTYPFPSHVESYLVSMLMYASTQYTELT